MVPAFEHDGFELYETGAIIRYLDRILPEPRLTPIDPKAEARMNQVMGILDSYAYPSLIGSLVIQRIVVPMMGGTPDEQAIAAALPKARTALAEIDRLSAGQPFLAGQEPSLADLLVAPVHAYLTATPEAAGLLEPHPGLRTWWERISARPSMAKTAPRLG
jgi:glutathione S-transferase